jgi:hypothetical protein
MRVIPNAPRNQSSNNDQENIFISGDSVRVEPQYLDRLGAIKDLAEAGMMLAEGMKIGFWMDDGNDQGEDDNLLFEGTVHFDSQRQQWYALIDRASFRHESDERAKSST